VAAPPGWTTVPAQDDSGWEVYRPAPAPHVAPKPRAAPAAARTRAPAPLPQAAPLAHRTGMQHRQAFASAPTSQIRWHRGAFFVADNRRGITTAGAACLLAAAIVFVLARA
jgi:hypothetical protein